MQAVQLLCWSKTVYSTAMSVIKRYPMYVKFSSAKINGFGITCCQLPLAFVVLDTNDTNVISHGANQIGNMSL